MLPSLTNGVSGNLCGFENKTSVCSYTIPADTASERINLQRRDHHWFDHDILPHCQALSTKYQNATLKVTNVIFDGTEFGNDCYKRDWKKKCVKWDKKVSVTCHLTRTNTLTDANPSFCPAETDFARPKPPCSVAFKQDYDAITHRIVEVEAVLSSYKKEVELYASLQKTLALLIDAKSNLKTFEKTPEQLNQLNQLLEILVAKSGSDAEIKKMEEAVAELVSIVSAIDSTSAQQKNDEEIASLKTRESQVSKELKAKEHLVLVLNRRMGELVQKQVESQSKI